MERYPKSLFLLKLVAFCLLMVYGPWTALSHASTAVRPNSPTGPVPGRFVVKLAPKADLSSIAATLSDSRQLSRVSPLELRSDLLGTDVWDRLYLVSSQETGLTKADLIAAIGADNIEYIEAEHYLEFYDFPTDPLFVHQWYLNNTGQGYYGIDRNNGSFNDSLVIKYGVAGIDINIAPFYFSDPASTTKVVVGIVDSGVDMEHPELADRLWKNPDEIPGNGIDDDHNGFVDDTVGYDLSGDEFDILNIVGDNDPTDQEGHGTHVAGIVASSADGVGVVGIAPQVEIMPVKVRPNATTATGAAGIMYAVNAGATVINVSWGSDYESYILKEAIDFARANGVFVAVAAGNSSSNQRFYPAAFESSFTVGATNSAGYLTEFSTWGGHLDLVAPGQDILSLRAKGTDLYADADEPGVHIVDDDSLYYLADGTSMAAPVVAGAAALLWSFRPDLSLDQLEDILRHGADDLIDPLDVGDTLIGPDTVCGYGSLNLAASFDLITQGGVYIASPEHNNRYTEDVVVRIVPTGGYSGPWQLDYSLGRATDDWQPLASGSQVPADSIVYTFSPTDVQGYVRLRLSDDYGNESIIGFIHVRDDVFTITEPSEGRQCKYNIPVFGTVYGPGYDSLAMYYRKGSSEETRVVGLSAEYFDTLMYNWNVSGIEPGMYSLVFYGYYGAEVYDTTIAVDILSSFTAGWPQQLPDRAGLTPVCADLDKDGIREIIVGTMNGLSAYSADGQPVPGFPLLEGRDVRGVPAVYDVDHDGQDEILVTDAEQLHVFNHDGTYVPGWPRPCPSTPLAYGFPQPTVTKLGASEDSAIVVISTDGQVYAYEFNGDSYFYSLEGWYARFSPIVSDPYYYSGNAVSSSDLTGDGRHEVIVSLSTGGGYSGVGLFDSRTGQPAFGMAEPQVIDIPVISGTVLSDLDGDGLAEIIVNGTDSRDVSMLWVKTLATGDFPGWPVELPEADGWLSSYPIVADLDLDGVPEILACYYEFDIASLYIFRTDGTPYIVREGRPAGEAFHAAATFGVPMVADLTGDQYPEIIIRGGHLLPGTGSEQLFILDHMADALPGWPIATPTRPTTVFSTPFAALVDDIDSDGLVELALIGDGNDLFIWDFHASSNGGLNRARLFGDNCNSSIFPGATAVATGVIAADPVSPPLTVSLSQNYPNPFNPTTSIRFDVPVASWVTIEVLNTLGQSVATLVDGQLEAGSHEVVMDGADLASGVYLYKLRVGESVLTRKMVLVK